MSRQEMRGDSESRDQRIEAARRLAEREAELAHVPNMQYNSPLNFLKDLAPEGWEYTFKRKYILEREDISNWIAAEQEGWEIVPLSDHPNFFKSKNIEMNQTHGGFFYKGAILCKRPISISNKRKNIIAKSIYDEIVKLNSAHADNMGANGMKPGQFMQETKWSSSDLPYDQEWGKAVGNI